MPRSLGIPALVLAALAIALPAGAQIFPDQVGDYQKAAPKTLSAPDQPLYSELGLDATEQADFKNPAGRAFSAAAWRMRDSTGAMALFELRRPPGASPAKLMELSVRTSDGMILAFGNYVFQLTGDLPGETEIGQLWARLPKLEQSPLPTLMSYLPSDGLIPNSERYVLGPVSLDRVDHRIPPSAAAFHLGSEAQTGKYKTPKGDITLAIFSYPTPNMAREQTEAFRKIEGAVVKRSGPLVAVTVQPPDPDMAQRVLAQVRYGASLTLSENIPQDFNKGLSNMILSIMALAGILIGLSIVFGVGFGGFRVLMLKLGLREDPGNITVLRLRD